MSLQDAELNTAPSGELEATASLPNWLTANVGAEIAQAYILIQEVMTASGSAYATSRVKIQPHIRSVLVFGLGSTTL